MPDPVGSNRSTVHFLLAEQCYSFVLDLDKSRFNHDRLNIGVDIYSLDDEENGQRVHEV